MTILKRMFLHYSCKNTTFANIGGASMARGGCEHASGVSSIFRVLDVDDFLFKLFGLQISFGIRDFLAVKHVSS
jgi:hypothetical protein